MHDLFEVASVEIVTVACAEGTAARRPVASVARLAAVRKKLRSVEWAMFVLPRGLGAYVVAREVPKAAPAIPTGCELAAMPKRGGRQAG